MKTQIFILLMVLSVASFAQQAAQYNHYIFNQTVINPAYTGTKGMLNINGIYASQWTMLEGAPSTQTLSIEGPAPLNLGLGFHVIQDKLGAQTQTAMYGNYSFKVCLSDLACLSFGIATGVTNNSLNGEELNEATSDDPAIPIGLEKASRFDSKAGIFFFTNKFYFGVSVSELTSNVRSSLDMLVAGQVKHYYVSSGYVFDVAEDLKFKAGFLIKEDFRAPTNVDLNGFFLYRERFWFGATYRTGADVLNSKNLDITLRSRDAAVVMVDMNISENFRLGYAYTITLSDLKDYAGHEVSLGYFFRENKKSKMLTPRYF